MKTTAAHLDLVDSVFYKEAATDNFWTLTGGALAHGYTRKYPLLIDAADTLSVLASNDLLTAAATAVLSDRSEGQVGSQPMQVNTAAVFTLGHHLSAAIKTATFCVYEPEIRPD